MSDMDIKTEFITEAKEHMATVESDVLAIETQGANVDPEIVNRLFRSIHTVKGGSSFLALTKITELSHALENIVGLVRNGELVLDESKSESFLKGVDKLNLLLDNTEDDEAIDISDSLEDLAQSVLGKGGAKKQRKAEKPEKADKSDKGKKAAAPAKTPELQDVSKFRVKAAQSGKNICQFVIDLSEECDGKDRTLVEFMEEVSTLGEILEPKLNASTIKKLESDKNDGKVATFIMETVIDDPEMLSVGLNISPLAIEVYPPDSHEAAHEKDTEPEEGKKAEAPAKADKPVFGKETTAVFGKESTAVFGRETTTIMRKPSQDGDSDSAASKMGDSTVRLAVSLLDRLMNLAGELVLVRNQTIQAINARDIDELTLVSQRLNVVTSDLQSSVMQTRMRPIGNVFTKFKRVVRDLAKKLGKEADLQIFGSEVELDKSIVEVIGDPLTHLVRNSVDHGIEMPNDREKKGKPRVGSVILRAFHQAGQVHVQIQDDGKGMDPEALKKSAIAKGFITEEDAAHMSREEAFNLIFLAGFSSAEKVTDVSGRGVGMDVVKSNFQKFGGIVDISSEFGKGTTMTVTFPLTLAIVPALIVMVEEHFFAIPQANVVEIVWLHGADVYQKLEKVDNQEVYWLRGKLLPILRLSKLLGIEKTFVDPDTGEQKTDRRAQEPDRRGKDKNMKKDRRYGVMERRVGLYNNFYIVMVRIGNEQMGIMVDHVIDTEEIVVKSLHEQLKTGLAFAGTTVMGDGKIAMILDMVAIAELGSFHVVNIEKDMSKTKTMSKAEKPTVLVFDIGGSESFAVPLGLIKRVERITRSQIQVANNREYVNFRNEVVPLIRLESTVDHIKGNYGEQLFVIVPQSDRPIGLVAANILDNIEIEGNIDSATIKREGVIGSTLLNGKLTLFLDIFAVIEKIEPNWFRQDFNNVSDKKKVLLVEDSPFYAAFLESYLKAFGFKVTLAINGEDATKKIPKGKFDIIISDIEMPVMGGLQLAQWIRSKQDYAGIPLIALSAIDTHKIKQAALDAGFDDFWSKLDKTSMVKSLAVLCKSEVEQ